MKNGKYEILAGERRYQSIRKLNDETPGYMEEIPCYIVGESDMSPIRKQLVIEVSNLESRDDYNRDTHRFQVVKLYKQLADEGSIEEKDLVKEDRRILKDVQAVQRHVYDDLPFRGSGTQGIG